MRTNEEQDAFRRRNNWPMFAADEREYPAADGEAAMVKAATKTKKPRRGRRPAASNVASYVIAIESWEWSFSFGVDKKKEGSDPYSDHRPLYLCGKMLSPQGMAGRKVYITLTPSIRVNEESRGQTKPVTVGWVCSSYGLITGSLAMPADVLPSLLTMFTAERIRYLTLRGAKINPRLTDIMNYDFEMDGEETDLPAAE